MTLGSTLSTLSACSPKMSFSVAESVSGGFAAGASEIGTLWWSCRGLYPGEVWEPWADWKGLHHSMETWKIMGILIHSLLLVARSRGLEDLPWEQHNKIGPSWGGYWNRDYSVGTGTIPGRSLDAERLWTTSKLGVRTRRISLDGEHIRTTTLATAWEDRISMWYSWKRIFAKFCKMTNDSLHSTHPNHELQLECPECHQFILSANWRWLVGVPGQSSSWIPCRLCGGRNLRGHFYEDRCI